MALLFSLLGVRGTTNSWRSPGEGGELPYMGYIGMCRCDGYNFRAVYSRIGYINQSIWVYKRVSFFRKLISWLKISSRVRSIGKSGFRFSKSKSGFPNRTRNPKTDFTSEKSVLRVDFNRLFALRGHVTSFL